MHTQMPRQEARLLDSLDDALVGVRRLSQRPGYRRRLLAGLDLPGGPGTIRVLRAVERSARSAPSIGEVAAALGLDPSTTSRVVDRCVVGGLLAREPHPGDRRRTHLSLTDAGDELLRAATTNRRALLAEATADWTAPDLKRLVELLRTLNEGFGRLDGW